MSERSSVSSDEETIAQREIMPKKAYANLDDSMRAAVIKFYEVSYCDVIIWIIFKFKEGMTKTQIAKALKCHRTTVGRIINKFDRTERFCKDKKGGDRRSILNDEHKQFILNCVDDDCTITLKSLTGAITRHFGF